MMHANRLNPLVVGILEHKLNSDDSHVFIKCYKPAWAYNYYILDEKKKNSGTINPIYQAIAFYSVIPK